MYRPSILLLFSFLLVGIASAQESLRAGEPATLLVSSDETAAARPVWSPDGRWIAFSGGERGGLWLAEADGSDARELTDELGAGFQPVWSPDGRALLTRASRYEGTRRLSAVRVFDVADGSDQQLTPYRSSMPTLPRWSPDGTDALLMSEGGVERFETGRPVVQGKSAPNASVLAADHRLTVVAATGETRPLPLSIDRPLLNVTPSPDGARIAFEVLGGNLFVVERDGTGLTDLGPGSRPTWSPDGAWIAYQQTTDDGHAFTAADLYAVRADGSVRVRLTDTSGRLEMSPAWRPDGRAIAFEAADEGALYLLPLAR